MDDGVQRTHPDLPNVHPKEYNPLNGSHTDPGIYGSHGTACAGIIGAAAFNGIGIMGIAPDIKILTLNNILGQETTTGSLANSLEFANDFGADVISCSWSSGIMSSRMYSAVDYATHYGREGKGCVVVASAGNQNGSAFRYPAAFENTISVGAIDRDYKRAVEENWGSNYGAFIDLVAPGVGIPTVDLMGREGYDSGDFFLNFGGTSAACPHVSGAAALMLSIKPDLSYLQVKELICEYALKIGGYNYVTTPRKPYGAWNDEVGYGLLDVATTLFFTKLLLDPISRLKITGEQSPFVGFEYAYYLSSVIGGGNPEIAIEWHCDNGTIIDGQGTRGPKLVFEEAGQTTLNAIVTHIASSVVYEVLIDVDVKDYMVDISIVGEDNPVTNATYEYYLHYDLLSSGGTYVRWECDGGEIISGAGMLNPTVKFTRIGECTLEATISHESSTKEYRVSRNFTVTTGTFLTPGPELCVDYGEVVEFEFLSYDFTVNPNLIQWNFAQLNNELRVIEIGKEGTKMKVRFINNSDNRSEIMVLCAYNGRIYSTNVAVNALGPRVYFVPYGPIVSNEEMIEVELICNINYDPADMHWSLTSLSDFGGGNIYRINENKIVASFFTRFEEISRVSIKCELYGKTYENIITVVEDVSGTILLPGPYIEVSNGEEIGFQMYNLGAGRIGNDHWEISSSSPDVGADITYQWLSNLNLRFWNNSASTSYLDVMFKFENKEYITRVAVHPH